MNSLSLYRLAIAISFAVASKLFALQIPQNFSIFLSSSAVGSTQVGVLSCSMSGISEENDAPSFSQMVEICDNGIDDDDDGLIDCYDPDCCESESCLSYYYNECPLECYLSASATSDIELEVEWESFGAEEWCSYNTPITGDIDHDGIPEIIGKPCPSGNVAATQPYPNLVIVDGASGMIEATIETPAFYYVMDAPALADVDHDGYAEIFVHASDATENNNYTGGGSIITGDVQRRILCYQYDGNSYVERWMSSEQIGYNDDQEAIAVSIADFNGDGIPELYCGNQILNSLTGELLVQGGADNHNGSKQQGDNPSLSQAYAIAVDVLPDSYCTYCEGLELVAGGMVYAVYLDPASPGENVMEVVQSLPGAVDGWTSIADLDKDGDLDAVVTTYNGDTGLLYAWDIQSPTAMYNAYITPPSENGFISQANIADFDGDGLVEIGICSQLHYQVIKPQGNSFVELWSIETDDSSGSTGSSVFDFNNDGSDEVVYRTETEILVLDGASGTMEAAMPCESGTRMEYPVVVDVDGDGETELLCSCDGKLTAFGSASTPWIDTRSVWNQRNYFNVNVEDDLTIPLRQQIHHLVGDSVVMNNFLTMYGALQSPLPDATVSIEEVRCADEDWEVQLSICNNGDNTLSHETGITLYTSNPTTTNADVLLTTTVGVNILIGDCQDILLAIPTIYVDSLYVVVNDDASLSTPYVLSSDFPLGSIAECAYENNIHSLSIADLAPPILDLSIYDPVCMGSETGTVIINDTELNWTFSLNGGEWQSESIFEGLGAGEYSLSVLYGHNCQTTEDIILEAADTFEIYNLPPMMEYTVGTELPLLPEVSGSGLYVYSWYPTEGLSCTGSSVVDCLQPIVSGITDTMVYNLTVSTENGECSVMASVLILPNLQCEGTYVVPNAFTPDGDGENDVFRLLHLDNGIEVLSFEVYNRWGDRVYIGRGDAAAWDGTYKGIPQPTDVYVYKVYLLCPDGRREKMLRGEVSLLR